MSFTELPAELIDMICSNCSVLQIKALRLTCQSLRNVADDYLFPEIMTLMTKDSMEAARRVAEHPKFCKQPTTLWVQGDRGEPLDFEDWKAKVARQIEFQAFSAEANGKHFEELGRISMKEDREFELDPDHQGRREALMELIQTTADAQPRPSYSETQLQEHFDHYSNLVREGTQIVTDGTIRRCMQTVFKKCTNISALYFTMANAIIPHIHKENETFQKGLITPFGDKDLYQDGIETMVAIIIAAADARFSPRSLRLGSVTYHLVSHPEIYEALPPFLGGVEDLQWMLATPWLDGGDEVSMRELGKIVTGFRQGHFLRFMQSTTSLRSLEIEMPCAKDPGEPRADLADVVGSISWPHLRKFSITTISAECTELVDFILRHADTLEYLELNEISLDGEWHECFSGFAGRLPRLEHVQLRGAFEEDDDFFCYFGGIYSSRGNKYSQKVAQYILEGGGEFPEPPLGRDGLTAWDSACDEDEESDTDSD